MLETALKAREAGLSVLPIRTDSKQPESKVLPRLLDPDTGKPEPKWDPFAQAIASEDEIRRMFANGVWMGVIAGEVSGHLEIADFDIPGKHTLPKGQKGIPPAYGPWREFMEEHGFGDLVGRLLIVETASGGVHLWYRCPKVDGRGGIQGSQKLARTSGGEVLIETRGERGYVVTYPTPGYRILQGKFTKIPSITEDERELLLNSFRVFNEKLAAVAPERTDVQAHRPGDWFNQDASWDAVLGAKGWQSVGRSAGGRRTWVRPGKSKGQGISATTGNGPTDLLYVHSTNAPPFEEGTSYSKFAAHCLLEHGGDWHFAAQHIRKSLMPKTEKQSAPSTGTRTAPVGVKVPAPGELDDLEEFGADAPPVTVEYLWDPYLPKAKAVLLDADGGTGKTSLALGVAAAFSQGRVPVTGEACEPRKTLYLHRGEDESAELNTVYSACAGVAGMIRYYCKGDLFFDEQGLDRVHGWIVKGGFSLVVVDALFYFLPERIEDTSNNLIAQRVVQLINDVAQDTRCTFWNQRHTTKGSVGKTAEHLGMGSVAFRNSHRGQLVARYHPSQRGVVVVEDMKGSILVPRGDHFAYRRVGNAIEFIRHVRNPFAADEPQTAPESAQDLISELCGDWAYKTAIETVAEQRGVSVSGALRRAMESMIENGLLEKRKASGTGPWMYKLSNKGLNSR